MMRIIELRIQNEDEFISMKKKAEAQGIPLYDPDGQLSRDIFDGFALKVKVISYEESSPQDVLTSDDTLLVYV